MKFTFFLALASAQTIFTGGQGKDGMEYQRYENSYMADLDSGFKEYMITLANESVTQETLKFTSLNSAAAAAAAACVRARACLATFCTTRRADALSVSL